MLRLLVLLLALLVGCSGYAAGVDLAPENPPPVSKVALLPMHGDTDFTPEERHWIEKAAHIWSLQTGGQARITVVYDLDFKVPGIVELIDKEGWYTLVRVDADSEAGQREGVLGNATAGGIHSGYRVGINIWADRIEAATNGDRIFVQVMLHEFGHGLGCKHLDDLNAIMYPEIRPKEHLCLTKPDLSEFCRLNSCDTPVYPCQ